MEGRGRLERAAGSMVQRTSAVSGTDTLRSGHPACGQSASLSQALVSCGSLPPSVSGPDVSSTSPCGNVIGSSPKLVIEAQPLARRYAMVPPGKPLAPSCALPGWSSGSHSRLRSVVCNSCRNASTRRYRFSMESGSADSTSTAKSLYHLGCGRCGSAFASAGEKPKEPPWPNSSFGSSS